MNEKAEDAMNYRWSRTRMAIAGSERRDDDDGRKVLQFLPS
jgi:hypothetical protein